MHTARMTNTAHLTGSREDRKALTGEFTMRFLGQNMVLTGWQWLELYDQISSITPDGQETRRRIVSLLERG